MNKEEQILRKKLLEAAENCFQRDIPIHTDFLNLYEQTIFHSMVKQFPTVRYEITGGYEMAERKVVCFLPSYMDSLGELVLSCVRVKPVNKRFAGELTHRDYLGAMMNLGIERNKTGDILVREDQCDIICLARLAPLIAEELHQVRTTSVTGSVLPLSELELSKKFETVTGSIASERLDGVLSFVYGLSRTKAAAYIKEEKVFIGGRLVHSGSYQLKAGEIVSVRGLGKFIYRGVTSQTRKGRLFVAADKYC